MSFILDTDTLSHYQQGHPRVGPAVDAWPPGALGVTIITVEEQFTGWRGVARRLKRPDQIAAAYDGWTWAVKSLRHFTVVGYTAADIVRYEQLLQLKLKIGKPDLRIAAIALEHGATVVTCNRRDFQQIPNLTIEDWSA
jgi:tRNA(fMet)-specific endonuclease VapC